MQASNIPTKVQVPFANGAGASYIRPIPVASQITTTPGAASFTDGFPPVTFEPTASGGIPPFGQDVNGILNQISAWTRWQCAGGPVAYDATWQAEVGGYPQGAIIESATTPGTIWLSLVDNNTTNPDTGGAGWINFATVILAYVVAAGATNAWTGTLAVPPASLYDGFLIRVQFGATNTSASPTFALNSFGAKVLYASDGATALAIGQLPKNALLQWSTTTGGWICLNVSTTVASVTANAPLSGNGTPGNPLQFTNPGYVTNVVTQSPITGNGTVGSPIGFTNPGYLTSVYVTAPLSGNGTPGNPLVGAFLPSVGGTLTGNVTQNVSGSATYTLNKASGSYATLIGQTGGSPDWGLVISNNVRQFAIARYSGGAYVENVLVFDPTTGVGNFTHQPAWSGSPLLATVSASSPLSGNGTPGNPLGFIGVAVDGTTITGAGTVASPLTVPAPPVGGGKILASHFVSSMAEAGSPLDFNIASVAYDGSVFTTVTFSTPIANPYGVIIGQPTVYDNSANTTAFWEPSSMTSTGFKLANVGNNQGGALPAHFSILVVGSS